MSQVDLLLEVARRADLFHTSDGTAFADIRVAGHRETWAVRSNEFQLWLLQRAREELKTTPSAAAMKRVVDLLASDARFGGPELEVHLRTTQDHECIYVDVCDNDWNTIEINAEGWRVRTDPPVRFRRSPGMRPLPIPEYGGSIDQLRRFLNVTDSEFSLLVAWVLMAIRGRGPFPVLVISGEHGSAKSTFSQMVRELIDPNVSPHRAMPRVERDLIIAAQNSQVLAFDNLSGLSPSLSDAICRVSTGGGFSTRRLFTDSEEALFNVCRPVILNGIEDIVTRPDLADRAIFINLAPIRPDNRRSAAELWNAFRSEHPRLLGALFDAMAHGLRAQSCVDLPPLPRMADFAIWSFACESAYQAKGTFWRAFQENRQAAVEDAIDADPVATAVRDFMANQSEWQGTASDFIPLLAAQAAKRYGRLTSWPSNASVLSSRLRRVVPLLRTQGIEIEFRREGHVRTRIIHITKGSFSSRPLTPSASSASLATERKSIVLTDDSAPKIVSCEEGGVQDEIAPAFNADGADEADARTRTATEQPARPASIAL